jgi:para-nitrobenzyl esterase
MSKRRWALWITGTLLLAILGVNLYVANRGGHYAVYAASNFSHLGPAASDSAAARELVVRISAGDLHGTVIGAAIAYRGIPYAQPPVGALRWEPPQAPLPWQGVREASQPGTACTQPAASLTPFFAAMAQAYGSTFEQPPLKSSEDCLYLDVWTPRAASSQPLPVMVWLHGGSNTLGSGAQPMYDGGSLTQHGVVLVTLNYRLGVMGFFSHPELTAESPHHSSGNYGLLDQLAALTWVKQNIAQFGGDPDNVTVFGESAGAIDAARLMTSPLSAGLFKHVISESGPAFEPGISLTEAESFGSAVSALAPGGAQLKPLEKLRALPAAEVEALAARAKEHISIDTTTATVDGWVFATSPRQAFVTGSLQKIDLLIGLNARELSAFRLGAAAAAKASGVSDNASSTGGLKKFTAAAQPCFGLWTNPAIALYFGRILLNKNKGIDGAANDLIAACPIGAEASLAQAAGLRVFVYRFDRTIPGQGEAELGAFHGLEVPFVFGSLKGPEWQWLPTTAVDASLSELIQTYWTQFAKKGDPNAPGLPPWPRWSETDTAFLVVNPDAGITAQRNFPPLLSSLGATDLKRRLQNPQH